LGYSKGKNGRDGWLKGFDGIGEWRASGSFPFAKLRVRMTARTAAIAAEAGFLQWKQIPVVEADSYG
jgi:hypothetical protein